MTLRDQGADEVSAIRTIFVFGFERHVTRTRLGRYRRETYFGARKLSRLDGTDLEQHQS